MRCSHCGQESIRGETNCLNCGISLAEKYNFNEIDFVFDHPVDNAMKEETKEEDARGEEAIKEQAGKQQKNRRKPVIAAITLLIGIIGLMFLVNMKFFQSHEYPYISYSQKRVIPFEFTVNSTKSIALLRADGKAVETIKSERIYTQSFSMSQEVVALTTGLDHKLYVITDKDQILIDDNVESALVSQDGTSVAYIKEVTKDANELHRYDVTTKTSDRIALDVAIDNYVLSPDGDSIAYVTKQEDGLGRGLYVSVDNKDAKMIKKGLMEIPLGISNHGKYLYVIEEEGFCLIVNQERIKLGNEPRIKLGDQVNITYSGIFFNRDLSQVLYIDDGKTYLGEKGEIRKIADTIVYGVALPPDASRALYHTGITSFSNQILQTEDGLYYLDHQYELLFICETNGSYQVAKNQDRLLLFEKNNELYIITGFHDRKINKEKIVEASNIKGFKTNPDLSIIYYINDTDELYTVKVGEEPIKLAEDVLFYGFHYHNLDGYIYYTADTDEHMEGNLFYSVNQEPGQKVMNLENGLLADLGDSIIAAQVNEDDSLDLYALKNGVAKLILSNVSN